MRAKRGNLLAAAWLVVVILSLLIPQALPKPAHACSCASSGSPKEAMAEADAVFFGRVTAKTVLSRHDGSLSSADPVTVEFDVIRVWKGPAQETVTVETERMGISCGYEFREGRRYIVYAYDGYTGLCTRTAPAWLAARDFAALGFGRKPEDLPGAGPISPTVAPTTPGNASGGGGCGNSASAGYNSTGVAPLVLLAGTIWLGMRWRRSRK